MIVRLALIFLFSLAVPILVSSCTTFALGKLASSDGSVLATHTNDGGGTTDPRLVKIPAKNHPHGSQRAIYASPEDYPRYVGYDRGAAAYYPEHCASSKDDCQAFEPIGYIPQVDHTYAYVEQTYGALNEKQVGLTESTCSGVFVAKSVKVGGKALLSIDQLSQIAMERASTAREAILLMGNLSQTYGFYGESTSFEGGSESLFVTDPNEAWAFHILADPTGSSSIWVAARIPDDSVAVVANMFSIREVNLTDTDNFLGREDMWEIAIEQGLYKEGDPKDFTKTFSDGEYSHKYYSGRRMWGVFRLLSASANLPADYDNLKDDEPYPFAVKVDQKVDLMTVMSVLRDWYADSNYSTGAPDQVLAGGPFGSPDRYSTYSSTGNWERTIAIYRSSDSYIVQSRAWLPDQLGGVLWFGPHAAHSTAYVPILTAMNSTPDCLAYGWQGVYNLSSSFWVHRNVHNLAQIKFSFMIRDIQALQQQVEKQSLALVNELSSSYLDASVGLKDSAVESITDALSKNAEKVRLQFFQLMHELLFKYADGYINYWDHDKSIFISESASYPQWWLDAVGYADGPPDTIHSPKKTRTATTTAAVEGVAKGVESLQSAYQNDMRQCVMVACMNTIQEHQYQACVKKCLDL
jgi:dipeptidase